MDYDVHSEGEEETFENFCLLVINNNISEEQELEKEHFVSSSVLNYGILRLNFHGIFAASL